MKRARTRLAIVAIAFMSIIAGFLGVGIQPAGATPNSTGSGMVCTSGTDHCESSPWFQSPHIPCMYYRIQWDHVWVDPGNPGAELAHAGAWWRETVERWWACNNGGPANFIATVGVFNNLDTVVPYSELVWNPSLNHFDVQLSIKAADWALNFDYTRGVTQWSVCGSSGNTPTENTSFGVYVSAASVGANTYLAGNQTFNATCKSNGPLINGSYGVISSYRQVTPINAWSYDGSYAKWNHVDQVDVNGGHHPYVFLTFW